MERFTLHVRLTKRCNADCSYCSSWQQAAMAYMPPEDFERAINFIAAEVLPLFGLKDGMGGHLSIQYIGGEILIVPRRVLRQCVLSARERFAPLFEMVTDGCQSNLIGAPDRIAFLSTLFGHRISTSIDSQGTQRRVKGRADLYRAMAAKGRETLSRRRGLNPAAIFVVDHEGVQNAHAEYERAVDGGYDLSLKGVFLGGRDVETASVEHIAAVYEDLFDRWAMTAPIILQPHYQLLTTRLATMTRDASLMAANHGCPFQKDCATVSLDLEPNGDLYICQDMADSEQFRLGNAVEGVFDFGVWEGLNRRREHFDAKCRTCPWLSACQGGCMSEAIHHTGSPYGRTALCPVWTALFKRIDALIDQHGAEAVSRWCRSVSGPKRRAPTPNEPRPSEIAEPVA